ncbi:hypothetical protein [Salipiger mangrovisoli]|uniref:Concanavalin A-like lectin/glucanases superfamily protein n=1 Tax=Salipiger mangrovisoli TaxID=2865933 RepID=A0ABR9XA24_9RHOB|nr:hypothetical protein [Salipiger mangrovisoli]MBE9640446.1 hypothetical protein [Salipiger mangrovisoli]
MIGLGISLWSAGQEGPGAPAPETAPFKVAVWGQSEDERILSQFYDELTPEPLVAQDMVTFWWHDNDSSGAAGVNSVTLNDATVAGSGVVTAAMVAMGNTFMRQLPGREVVIVMQVMAGTDPRTLMGTAADPARDWQDDWALHAAATADGVPVHYLWQSWYAAPGSLGADYGESFAAFLFGKALDGSDLVYSEASPLDFVAENGIGFPIARTLRDLYGSVPMVIANNGAHRFEIQEDHLSAVIVAADQSQQANLVNKERCTKSWRALLDNAAFAAHFTAPVLQLNAYANGIDDGDGSWSDSAHPSAWTDEGLNFRARQIAHAILRGAAVTSWAPPVFDMCAWQADGSYVEVWSSAGDVTTLRAAAGDPALDDSFPHWTDVAGWQIDGDPAQRAELVSGRVRLYPNDGGSFNDATSITFGEGGATGMLERPEDFDAALYRDYPIIDLGLPDVPGLPVCTLPDAAALASTIPGDPSFATTNAGPYFEDAAGAIGSGVTAVTARIRGTADFSSASGTPDFFGINSNVAKVELIKTSGTLRVYGEDSSGSTVVNGVLSAAGVIADGVEFDMVFSHDIASGFLRVWVDGALVIDASFPADTGELSSIRIMSFLATAGGTEQLAGSWKILQAWKQGSSDGSLPVTPPHVEITGPAPAANAHAWKQGADAS